MLKMLELLVMLEMLEFLKMIESIINKHELTDRKKDVKEKDAKEGEWLISKKGWLIGSM